MTNEVSKEITEESLLIGLVAHCILHALSDLESENGTTREDIESALYSLHYALKRITDYEESPDE